MTIVVTGGGSGGHITPILAVASELKRQHPEARIVYVGQKGDALADIPAQHPDIDEVFTVSAGKLRRYAGEGWKQLLDLKTQALNIRDVFRTLGGIWQSYRLMKRLKPAVIFSRGGFVSVPVCLGGRFRGIPYITHDSDTVPSLANRMIARWAAVHAVALPKELYPYPSAKTVTVGIPLSGLYVPVTPEIRARYRHELGLERNDRVVLITGGGNGAGQLNDIAQENVLPLLKQYSNLIVIHVAGRAWEATVGSYYRHHLSETDRQRVRVKGFVTDLYRYSGAADVVIARGGATNLAEFAIQGLACIIIPAEQLVGGHQVKNAQALANQQAVVLLDQAQAEQERRLAHTVSQLLDDPARQRKLAENLTHMAQPDAARRTAELIFQVALGGKVR